MASTSVKLIPRELREMQFQEARFLTEEEHAKYQEACRAFGEKARKSLNVHYKGSNLFEILLLNQLGIRTATLPELESALENGMQLEGTYEDSCSVVLRSAGDSYKPNDYIAKALAKLIKNKSFPHAVVVEGLKVKEDDNSEYGLSFEKGEKFRVVEASALDNKNNQRRFKRINPDYTFDFGDKAERTLYTRENGVSRVYLYRDLDLSSRDGGLADSDDGGRVVVVSGEATSQNFLDEYASDLKEKSARQIAEISERARKAEHYLKTGQLE